MNLADLTAELEEDLAWRQSELAYLRNSLLGEIYILDWPTSAMRTVLVMQYAHLEGFVRNSVGQYLKFVNDLSIPTAHSKPQLLAAALASEFRGLRTGSQVVGAEEAAADEEDGAFAKRARRQVDFVQRLRVVEASTLAIDPDEAVSLEMNLGKDILRRTLYSIGIPEDEVEGAQYNALEFVRKTRNDVAHGGRFEVIDPRKFDAARRKCEQFMGDLRRVVVRAVREEWFLQEAMRVRNSR